MFWVILQHAHASCVSITVWSIAAFPFPTVLNIQHVLSEHCDPSFEGKYKDNTSSHDWCNNICRERRRLALWKAQGPLTNGDLSPGLWAKLTLWLSLLICKMDITTPTLKGLCFVSGLKTIYANCLAWHLPASFVSSAFSLAAGLPCPESRNGTKKDYLHHSIAA